ncbi:MAG: hypothetical protein ABSC19_13500 [Syntrophorhabdales bacterium]
MAKDFWPIGEARKGQMYWMYMTFSQRSGRTFRNEAGGQKDEPDGPFIF